MAHRFSQSELHAVISAITNAAPCVQRRELVIPEVERSIVSIQRGAGRCTIVAVPGLRKISEEERGRFVECVTRELVVHRLCGCVTCRRQTSIRRATIASTDAKSGLASGRGKEVFPEGNWR